MVLGIHTVNIRIYVAQNAGLYMSTKAIMMTNLRETVGQATTGSTRCICPGSLASHEASWLAMTRCISSKKFLQYSGEPGSRLASLQRFDKKKSRIKDMKSFHVDVQICTALDLGMFINPTTQSFAVRALQRSWFKLIRTDVWSSSRLDWLTEYSHFPI